jgi:hypothetical protein
MLIAYYSCKLKTLKKIIEIARRHVMFRNIGLVLVLGFTSAVANAATIWQPTSTDTDFFTVLDFAEVNIGDAQLFLFDDDDAAFSNGLVISNGGEVWFNPPPPATGTITAASYDIDGIFLGDIELSINNNFILAVTRDGGTSWLTDTAWEKIGADSYLIDFHEEYECDTALCANKASIVGVDLQPVPVPAAVWLFGSGLLGLVAVARRRV